jgi:PmbA protein
VGEGIETWLVATPRSGPVLSRASRAWAMAVALAGPTDDEVVGEAQDVAWALDDVELARVAATARARALAKLGAERLPTGARAVVLAPAVVAELLEGLVGGLSGDVYDRGGSFLSGRLGAPVFGPGITLFDDPHQPRLAGSAWIDAEGVPTQPRALVREGRVVALLDDAKTAADGGRTGGGCAQRGSEFSRPRPGPSNLVLGTGTTPREALLAGALLVESLSGGHLVDGGVDAVSVGVVGALFDAAGRRGPSIAGVSLAAPWTTLLGAGARASREAEAHGAVIAPWLRVEDISIGGDVDDDDPEAGP